MSVKAIFNLRVLHFVPVHPFGVHTSPLSPSSLVFGSGLGNTTQDTLSVLSRPLRRVLTSQTYYNRPTLYITVGDQQTMDRDPTESRLFYNRTTHSLYFLYQVSPPRPRAPSTSMETGTQFGASITYGLSLYV